MLSGLESSSHDGWPQAFHAVSSVAGTIRVQPATSQIPKKPSAPGQKRAADARLSKTPTFFAMIFFCRHRYHYA